MIHCKAESWRADIKIVICEIFISEIIVREKKSKLLILSVGVRLYLLATTMLLFLPVTFCLNYNFLLRKLNLQKSTKYPGAINEEFRTQSQKSYYIVIVE